MSRRIVTSLAVVLFTGALGSMLATCGRPADASTPDPGLAASMAPVRQLRGQSCAGWSLVRRSSISAHSKRSNLWWSSTIGSPGSGLHRRTKPTSSRFAARCDSAATQLPGVSVRVLVEQTAVSDPPSDRR